MGSLSEKTYNNGASLLTGDVKEFIKELKEDISEWKTENLELELSVKSAMNYLIDKLAGEELVK